MHTSRDHALQNKKQGYFFCVWPWPRWNRKQENLIRPTTPVFSSSVGQWWWYHQPVCGDVISGDSSGGSESRHRGGGNGSWSTSDSGKNTIDAVVAAAKKRMSTAKLPQPGITPAWLPSCQIGPLLLTAENPWNEPHWLLLLPRVLLRQIYVDLFCWCIKCAEGFKYPDACVRVCLCWET